MAQARLPSSGATFHFGSNRRNALYRADRLHSCGGLHGSVTDVVVEVVAIFKYRVMLCVGNILPKDVPYHLYGETSPNAKSGR